MPYAPTVVTFTTVRLTVVTLMAVTLAAVKLTVVMTAVLAAVCVPMGGPMTRRRGPMARRRGPLPVRGAPSGRGSGSGVCRRVCCPTGPRPVRSTRC